MPLSNEILVTVGRHRNSIHFEHVPFGELTNIHWDKILYDENHFEFLPDWTLLATATILNTDMRNTSVRSCGAIPETRAVVISKKQNEEIWAELLEKFPRPQSYHATPFTKKCVKRCVDGILQAILHNEEHPALHFSKRKKCWYIVPKDMDEIVADAGDYTLSKRCRRVREALEEVLKTLPEYKLMTYRSYLAFKPV